MWDTLTAFPFGRLSKRRILLFVALIIATVFSYLFILSTPVQAADADVTWKGGDIVYSDNTYVGPKAEPDDKRGLPADAKVFTHVGGRMPFGNVKVSVIYFGPDADPATSTTAQYVTFERTAAGKFINKSDPRDVSVDAATSADDGTSASSEASSCEVDGIGWIVCPTTNALATGMDWVFAVLSGFVEVRALETNTDAIMYRIWDTMRGFANVAFVIAFLIIIYSQLTSVGLSNYGIKKLLPRIIFAAILVNVSYWICTIAIDLSNILGYSFQNLFLGLRDTIIDGGGENGWQLTSWQSVTSFILAGGAATGATIVGLTALSASMVGFSVIGVVLLLAPILVGAFITILVVLFILAGRQAIITILVIISPLALVAYLLPNTEKWFEKWRGLFMTMLIFFPAFSLVFGGAQFAGIMIIQNASDINMLLLGMAVQIAPLAITPLLLRLSGSLLSKIGGMINDPSRGLKDRTKNWSKDRMDVRRAKEGSKNYAMAKNGTLGKRHAMRRTALGIDRRRRLREGQKAVSETRAGSLFNQTQAGAALNAAEREADREKQTVENQLKTSWDVKARIDPNSLDKEIKLRVTADEASLAAGKMDSVYEEIKRGDRQHAEKIFGTLMPNGPQVDQKTSDRVEMLNRARDTTDYLAFEGIRKSQAEQEQKKHVDKVLYKNEEKINGKSVLEYAAGIGESETLQATTIARVRKEFIENVGSQSQLMQHVKLSSNEFQMASTALDSDGNAVKEIVIDDERGKHTFQIANKYVREAAIEHQKSAGSFSQKLEIIEASGKNKATGEKGTTYDFRDSVQDLAKSMTGAAPFIGDKSLDAILGGNYAGRESSQFHSVRQILEGRFKSETLSTTNAKGLEIIFQSYGNESVKSDLKATLKPEEQKQFDTKIQGAYQDLRRQAHEVLSNPILRKNTNKEAITQLQTYAMNAEEVKAYDLAIDARRAADEAGDDSYSI